VTEAFPPQLHELEREIMQVVWQFGSMSVRDVLVALNAGDRQRAYTTVMTTMSRLWEKGLLRRERLGRADVYEPVLAADEYRQARAAREVEALLSEYGDVALAHFAREVGALDAARLARLREIGGE
jgi:predicted transcriptional regulator